MVFDGGHCEAGWTWYLMVVPAWHGTTHNVYHYVCITYYVLNSPLFVRYVYEHLLVMIVNGVWGASLYRSGLMVFGGLHFMTVICL